MSAHTPGPWKVVYEGSGPQCRPAIIHADMLEILVDRRRDMADPMPDARLIAAAPRMYEELARLYTEEGAALRPDSCARLLTLLAEVQS